MDASTRDFVRDRADDRCEYCRLPAFADEWPYHVDHIVARCHGGVDDRHNLCWSCTQCNLHKGPNLASIDPQSGARVDLFNPRTQSWNEHFRMEQQGRIVGLSATGRATARLLDTNGSPRIELRRELIVLNMHPLD